MDSSCFIRIHSLKVLKIIMAGLFAEQVRNRDFEEIPNIHGLSRYWEQYPDKRNDDGSISFQWDDSVAYPVSDYLMKAPNIQHSLKIKVRQGVLMRHGIYQSGIPVRKGIDYIGYIWIKTTGYEGKIIVTFEPHVFIQFCRNIGT